MDSQPVRKITTSHRSIVGTISSTKNLTLHKFESSLERDFIILLEFDDSVKAYTEQPMTIFYQHNGKRRRYTPDFLVTYNTDLTSNTIVPALLCEIKYQDDLRINAARYETKFNAARQFSFEQGYTFQLITEADIRSDYLNNVKFLSGYKNEGDFNTDSCRIINNSLFVLGGKCRVSDVINYTPPGKHCQAELLAALWHMIAVRSIKCNLHTEITMDTEIWSS